MRLSWSRRANSRKGKEQVKVPILGWEFPPYFADGVSVVQLVEDLELDFDVVHAHDWATYPAGGALKQASFGAVSPLKRGKIVAGHLRARARRTHRRRRRAAPFVATADHERSSLLSVHKVVC